MFFLIWDNILSLALKGNIHKFWGLESEHIFGEPFFSLPQLVFPAASTPATGRCLQRYISKHLDAMRMQGKSPVRTPGVLGWSHCSWVCLRRGRDGDGVNILKESSGEGIKRSGNSLKLCSNLCRKSNLRGNDSQVILRILFLSQLFDG